jgi:polysaccharide deacetylase 2 family uncharacterized protein YibQ
VSAPEEPPVQRDTEVHAPLAPAPAPPAPAPAPHRGPRLWMVLLAGAVGALLTLGLDAWFRSEPVPTTGRTPPRATAGGAPATDAAPPEVVDPAPARDLVLQTLAPLGVSAESVAHGVYPLRGPGRRPGETFALLGITCPPGRNCTELLGALEAPLSAAGYQISRNIGGDRPGRPLFRAVSRDSHPTLAVRAWPAGPRLTLVVDDLGREPAVLDRLLALDEHVTFALLPNTASATQMAARLADAGREIIAHLPMEPQPPAEVDGPDFLTTSQSPDEAGRAAERLLDRLPGAVGANNHLGGRFTTSPAHMAALLNVLKQRSMFFVDDRTSPASVAEATAKVIGVRTSARTHSLDVPGQDVRAAFKAVEAALVLDGQAVVVAHGDPDTLTALGPWLDDLKRRNIHLFRLSEVVL